jgi:hypothetical protein
MIDDDFYLDFIDKYLLDVDNDLDDLNLENIINSSILF